MKTQSIGKFLGINNRLPDSALTVFENGRPVGTYLREAINVDINAGRVKRRKATSRIDSAPAGVHSLQMITATTGYAVRAGALYAITLPSYSETLVKVLSSNAAVSWHAAESGDLYFSNGTDSGRVSAAGIAYPWALPTPAAPDCSTIAGSLFAGKYQVAVSYSNSATGEEGGVSPSSNPVLSATGGIRVSLPGATAGATHVNLYLAPVNGSVPLFVAQIAASTASYDIASLPIFGREAPQRFEAPLPAGELFSANGRLCSIKGNMIYVGLPFRPGYYLPAEGFIPFPANVAVAVPAQGGTFVATAVDPASETRLDRTYWIPGDIGGVEGVLIDVLPYGAVPGTGFSSPNKSIYGWFGARGIVLGKPSGEVEAVMSDNIDLVPPASGRSVILEDGGVRRVVSCGWAVSLDSLAATTYADFDFTSYSGGYGTKADGIYLLESGGLADGWIDLGKIDFGSETKKSLPSAYLGFSSESPMLVRVVTSEKSDFTYPTRGCGEMDIRRVDMGKGLSASWFWLRIYNQDGEDFELASVSFAPIASNRRV